MKLNTIVPNKEYIKEKQMLERICEECGRRSKVPAIFCNDCWMTMRNDLCKSKK